MSDALMDEYRALREGCAVVDRSSAGRIELAGADRQRFANAYLTCDVKALPPGGGAYGFVTSNQGRILSDAVVLALDDRLWMELGPGQEGPIADHLKKYILADRVEVRPLEDTPVALIGPRAAEVLGEAAADLPEGAWSHGRRTVLGVEVVLQRSGPSVPWDYTLWAAAGDVPRLIESLEQAGARRAGLEALEILRAEKGLPQYGRDYGADNFPQETGLEEAVSYTKGCYLGQEVVARIHYRGGVQKSLRGLVFEGEPPAPGAALLAEGRESGKVTTVVHSPALGEVAGLAILHRRAAAPGTRLEVAGGGTAVVRELPLAP